MATRYARETGSDVGRFNLECPFEDKDKVKALGARWDQEAKTWYIAGIDDLTPFMPWIPGADQWGKTQTPG